MKIAVLGGGGFVGSAVSDRLLVAGHSVRIFERAGTRPYREFAADEDVQWLVGDFVEGADVARAVAGMEVVVHLVSTTLPKSSNENIVYDIESNLVGTVRLLDAMVAHGVPKIVFVSSGGTVYGEPVYLPIDEAHPTMPHVSYGITKLAIEKYLTLYQRLHGLKAIVLRVANPFGARQRVESAQGAVGVFLHRALRNEPIEIWGDGSIVRDYIFVGDVADAFLKAVDYEGTASIFNIGSGVGTSLNELLRVIEHILGKALTRRYLPRRELDVAESVLDNSLARRELGWTPRISLETGISRTVEWMQRASK